MFFGNFFSFKHFAGDQNDFHGEMRAYRHVIDFARFRKLITEQEIERIRPTYKFNLIAGLSRIIQSREEVEYILNADDATLERLEKNLKLICSYNFIVRFNLTIPGLMAYPDEVLDKINKHVEIMLQLNKKLFKDKVFDAILERLTPEFLQIYARFSDLIKSEDDLKTLSGLTADELQQLQEKRDLIGIYELNMQDVINLQPEFAQKLLAGRRFFVENHTIYSDDYENKLTKKEIVNLSPQQLDNIIWFENNIVDYSTWESFPKPQPRTTLIKQFYIIADLDENQRNKLSIARKADVVPYYGVDGIIGFSMDELQTISEKIEPYFNHIFSSAMLYQKDGDKRKFEPHRLRPIEEKARELREIERDSLQVDLEGRKELDEMIQALFSPGESTFPDAELRHSNFMNVSLWDLVRYPNSVKAYLADGTLTDNDDKLLDLIKRATQNHCPESLAILLNHPIKKTVVYQSEINKSLLLAAENGFLDCVEILVEHGANLDTYDSKNAFEMAIWEGHQPTATYLWQKFHDVTRNYETNKTPMHIAAQRGLYKILRMMIDDGAEVDPRGYKNATPLALAIQSTDSGVSREDALKTIELLLEAGANPNAIVDSRTVYDATQQLDAEYRHEVQTLIQSKSKHKVKTGIPDFGHPADDHSDFFNAAYEGDMERFQKYLRLYQIGRCSHNGETALHFAAKNKQYAMAEFLLSKGINPAEKGYTSFKTALDIAKDKNDMRMVSIIASHSETKNQPGFLFFETKSSQSEDNSQSNDQDNQYDGIPESPKYV